MTTPVEHQYPRAFKASCEVDSMLLAGALDHIAKTAAKSRSQTRRIRWIHMRAEMALRGEEYADIDCDLPKSAGPDTAEKLQRRLARELAVKHQLIRALRKLAAAVSEADYRASEAGHPLCIALREATVLADQISGAHP